MSLPLIWHPKPVIMSICFGMLECTFLFLPVAGILPTGLLSEAQGSEIGYRTDIVRKKMPLKVIPQDWRVETFSFARLSKS